jgi:hypothetical protein
VIVKISEKFNFLKMVGSLFLSKKNCTPPPPRSRTKDVFSPYYCTWTG